MKLGSLTLVSKFFLSPLESVSDVGFRHVCASLGAGITWTEMIRAQAVARQNNSALDLIDTIDNSTPTGIQLLAKTPKDLEAALLKIEQLASTDRPHYRNIIAVDLNFGCPSPSIIKEGAGPALLKRKQRLSELFEVLSQWKKTTSMPSIGAIGCKIRLGLNKTEMTNKVYMQVAEVAVKQSLDYMVVHGRHAGQRSSEPAFWSPIREIKQFAKESDIKIVGNGDASDWQAANRMISETGCDAVMIARGAIRNPWIFKLLTQDETSRKMFSEMEVRQAHSIYLQWAQQAKSKSKFVDFHKENFDRLINASKNAATFSASLEKFRVPTNSHIN
jgi:tRNA-dihydrouridine synthase B